ncbi:MAG: aryl-sulfate sulfotransferase [Bacteroidales bacterium]
MKKTLILIYMLFLNSGLTNLYAQTYDGYTLYSKMGNNKAYLLNMDKTIYHQWSLSGSTGYSTYLLPGGTLLRTVVNTGNQLFGAAMCGKVQKVAFNGTLLWSYVHSSSTYCTHHDICAMPNGNVLMIAYEVKTPAQVSAAGCSQSITIWPEKIIEVQPTGATTGNIVWEWHVWDHLVQNVDPSKPNYYSSIADHPELLNINYQPQKDWMHANGIHYNADLDQIVFSSHNMNEFYIIDHSTTTAEAAGHTGGNSGKGGDFLYRWGNPQVYGCGTISNRIFNVVHDAHWIPVGYPKANHIAAFNNKGSSTNGSCVDIIYPPYDGFNYSYTPTTAFTPSVSDWRHNCLGTAQDMSNSQQLPNGNMLICVAMSGYIYEIDSNQNILWSHTVGGSVAKAFRYSSDYVSGTTSVDNVSSDGFDQLVVFPNPATDFLNIKGSFLESHDFILHIYNALGSEVFQTNNSTSVDISQFPDGLYLAGIESGKLKKMIKFIKH